MNAHPSSLEDLDQGRASHGSSSFPLKVYLAGGWFSPFQDTALSVIEDILSERKDIKVYSPRREMVLDGNEDITRQNTVFEENVKQIKEADIVISSTVDKDMGTLFECGYANAIDKPIIYTFFDKRFDNPKFNLMLASSGIACFTNVREFITFLNKVTKSNFKEIEQRYEGDFE